MVEADENIDPALAAPPPPFWCSVHGWVVCPPASVRLCPLHQEEGIVLIDDEEDGAAPLQHPTPAVVEAEGGAPLRSLPMAARAPSDAIAPPRLPSPTSTVVEVAASHALAFVSGPTGASSFVFGSGAGGSSNHAVVDVDAVAPRLLSPKPATPPLSPRAGVRRRLLALGVPPSSSRSGQLAHGAQRPSSSRMAPPTTSHLAPSFLEALPTRMSAAGVPLATGDTAVWPWAFPPVSIFVDWG